MTSHTSFSQSASAFCRRRISTSTWLRACFSLTSSAPLSVSALVSTSLHEPSSSWVLSHLRRQSSKFWTTWMMSDRGDVVQRSRDRRLGRNLQHVLVPAVGKYYTQDHKELTWFNVLIEQVNVGPQLVVQALDVCYSALHVVLRLIGPWQRHNVCVHYDNSRKRTKCLNNKIPLTYDKHSLSLIT